MRRASIVGLLISILFCLLSRLGNSQERNETTIPNSCKSEKISEYLPTPKTATIRNIGGALWISVTIIALLCNALIIHVVRVNKNMHTTINYLIVNMAFGDTLAAIVTTIAALYITYKGHGWAWDEKIGEFLYCRMICPLYYLSMLCSIYSLVVITFDRFLAVACPVKYKNRSSWSKYTIPCIWVASVVVASHYALRKIVFCSSGGEFYCVPQPSKLQAFLMMSLGFVLPHFIILTLYAVIVYKLCIRKVPGQHAQSVGDQTSKEKLTKKVTLMIVCIFVAFDVTYVPVYLVYLLPLLLEAKVTDNYLEVLAYKTLLITNGISNVLIYAVFNDKFRHAFKKALPFSRLMISGEKLSKRFATKRVSPSSQDKTSSTGT